MWVHLRRTLSMQVSVVLIVSIDVIYPNFVFPVDSIDWPSHLCFFQAYLNVNCSLGCRILEVISNLSNFFFLLLPEFYIAKKSWFLGLNIVQFVHDFLTHSMLRK